MSNQKNKLLPKSAKQHNELHHPFFPNNQYVTTCVLFYYFTTVATMAKWDKKGHNYNRVKSKCDLIV